MNKLRFHLGRGEHYMHWQHTFGNDKTYTDPETDYGSTYLDVKLVSSKTTAKKIHDGDNKTVCAWLQFKSNWPDFEELDETDMSEFVKISYNPREAPHWTIKDLPGIDLDGMEFCIAKVRGRDILVSKRELVIKLKNKYGIEWHDHVELPF
jgi:hypothetical protein